MRICLLTREFSPLTPYPGGIGRAFAGLARGLAEEGHDVSVVVPGLERTAVEHGGIPLHGVPSRAGAIGHVATVLAARRAVERTNPDIVFAPEWRGDDAPLPGPRRRRACHVTNLTSSLRQIRTITPDARRLGELRPQRRVQHFFERRQAERADGVVAVSNAILEWARELWDLETLPSAVIPNGIDVEWVQRLARQPAGGLAGRDGPKVVFAGRLEALKGIPVLAEAMREVWRSFPAATLVLAGRDGAWHGRRMSEHVLDVAGENASRVVVLGEQPPELLFPTLAAADVVALPSLWEAQGLVALEALAAGAPVVATRGTGFEWFVRDGVNGLLVERDDPRALASSLSRLLADGELRSRCAAAAASSVARFDLRSSARRHAEFFAEVMSSSRVTRGREDADSR